MHIYVHIYIYITSSRNLYLPNTSGLHFSPLILLKRLQLHHSPPNKETPLHDFFHETTLPETNIAPENGWLEY